MARREWTSVDFSGCTLASGDLQVIVIVSLLVTSGSNEFDIQSLEQQVCGIYIQHPYKSISITRNLHNNPPYTHICDHSSFKQL